jgi:GTP pyrophosphokinase
VGGTAGISYRLATCCKPLPGKDIIAYNSRGLEFLVHEAGCKALNKLDAGRFIEAHFCLKHSFKIEASDRIGILRDCTTVIANHGLNIINSSFVYNKNRSIATWDFTVESSSDKELQEMEANIWKIPNIITFKMIDKKQ